MNATAPTSAATKPQTTLDLLRAVGTPNPVVDLGAARQFIRAITRSLATPMAWIVLPENAAACKAREPSLFLYGTLAEHVAALTQANAQGCSVECIVNKTRGAGMTSGDVSNVRALWISTDSDRARFTREQVDAIRPKPHLIVEACEGEYDLYWVMQDGECALADFAPSMWHITRQFKSSRSVLAIEHRFRVPGFWTWRDESKPFQVEVVSDRGQV